MPPPTPGTLLGTVGYMAPEQVRGEPVDARADLFALGAVLYEMLTGERAFGRATAVETMSAILRDDPPRDRGAAIPAELGRVIAHCLEKRPETRFQNASDLAFDLERLLEPRPARSRRAWPVLALAAVIAGAMAVGYAVLQRGAQSSGASPPAKLGSSPARKAPRTPRNLGDGRRLVYCATEQGLRHLVLRDLTDGSEKRLTDGAHDDLQPALSSDGSTLYFVRRGSPGHASNPATSSASMTTPISGARSAPESSSASRKGRSTPPSRPTDASLRSTRVGRVVGEYGCWTAMAPTRVS